MGVHRQRKRVATWILYPILFTAALCCWCFNLILLSRISSLEHAQRVVASGMDAQEAHCQRRILVDPKSSPRENSTSLVTAKPVSDIHAQLSEANKLSSNKTDTNSSSYAYAWVMGGIHENRPAYKGFLYDILISVNVLKRLGSQADFWLWIQMAPDATTDELPHDETKMLKALGVHIKQLDKPATQSFASLVYDKFRTLQMTGYKRVIFLDADIIPLVNMDYLFHLSDPDYLDSPTILRPNLILASRGEPCNTGMFMVEPGQRAWERLQAVTSKQRESAKELPYPHFDFKLGWGHRFKMHKGDYWEGIHKVGNQWHFHAGHSDQGLMYYYVKYVTQDVSIAIGDRLQNWMPSEGGGPLPRKVFDVKHALKPWSPDPIAYQNDCYVKPEALSVCSPPYRDFAHFMGNEKPWQKGVNFSFMKRNIAVSSRRKYGPHKLWFQELATLNEQFKMGLDIKHWDTVHMEQMKKSPLGYMATYKDHVEVVKGGENQTESDSVELVKGGENQTRGDPVEVARGDENQTGSDSFETKSKQRWHLGTSSSLRIKKV